MSKTHDTTQTTEPTEVQKAVGLVEYRRQLLRDAKAELSTARKRVRLCEKALREAEWQMSDVCVAASRAEVSAA